MPIQPNFLERTAFFSLNAAPAPMLDLAGALAFRTLSTAVHLNLFATLAERPFTPAELAQHLNLHERGTHRLLEALAAIGYVAERNGRYHNTSITEKWFLDNKMMDMTAAMTSFDNFFQELWPHAPEVVRSGKRPFDFYQFTATTPGLSDAHQRMMQGNANLVGPAIVKKMGLSPTANRLLDVGGGHGQFTIHFCQAHRQLSATIMDSEIALETARQNVTVAELDDRVDLYAADLWQAEWGSAWDGILLFNLLHHYDLETNQKLLQKAHAALKPGAKVAIFDQVASKAFGSATNAIIKLVGLMYYLFADGRTFTRNELTNLLNDTNFRNIQFHPLRQAPGSSLLVAEK
ncbi:methyltransferase [Candidatus Leptofilum sp.]|uniref:methyltransferase n=1 Tax=Candidatus Leptofilum sp. TaxID=3241576 RepID=UPI003B594910